VIKLGHTGKADQKYMASFLNVVLEKDWISLGSKVRKMKKYYMKIRKKEICTYKLP
jgi:hypothetical protein